MKNRIYFIVIVLCLMTGGELFASGKGTRFFSANHVAIRYMGRVKYLDSQVAYNWPGVNIISTFSGRRLGIQVDGGERNYLNIWVDDRPAEVLHAPNDTIWWYPHKLKRGNHQLRIVKRTEADMGQVVFSGLHLGKRDSLMSGEELPERKMLFVGNSITCGYGTEGKDKTEKFLPSTENCEKSFAPILARAFKAQYQLIAHSGLGMVRNYGDSLKKSVYLKPMPARLRWLMDNDTLQHYDMKAFVPDAVVVNLGTNDFSTLPHPDLDQFISAGCDLFDEIYTYYPKCKLFCIGGPMVTAEGLNATEQLIDYYLNKHPNVTLSFLPIPVGLLNADDDLGSSWHPSYKGQLKVAMHLLPFIARELSWDFTSKEGVIIGM